ncbi:tannase and feruloyl esterase-domain-containing protein [Aspergillus germanicus]
MNITACTPSAIQLPAVYGADILSLTATWTSNFTLPVPADFNYNHGDVAVDNADFCNITVTYTHPGYADRITVETWLPRDWNGRLQATGGGGWQAGRFVLSEFFMAGAIGEGPGNVDIVALQNLGSRSLNDQALIGKSLIRSFYGREPEYSYWSGCSQGGRQGLMLAQRYPTAYDGIAASAPAQSWTKLTSGLYYPILARAWHKVNPLACELDFLTAEAIAACDPKDGIVDGLISDMAACDYSPYSSVNKTFFCESLNRTIGLSHGAALVADAAWSGPKTSDGETLWYGVNSGSDISSLGSVPGQNTTSTTSPAGSNTAADPWFGLFVAKNASSDPTTMTFDEYVKYFDLAIKEYSGFIDAADPDLTEFRKRGGKLIAYHGMADPSIPTKGSEFYYDSVEQRFPDVHDFYRLFESPGLGHCSGGKGGQPTTVFDALRDWVENGTAPETLPVAYPALNGTTHNRILCPYPKLARYVGGDVSSIDSFKCA